MAAGQSDPPARKLSPQKSPQLVTQAPFKDIKLSKLTKRAAMPQMHPPNANFHRCCCFFLCNSVFPILFSLFSPLCLAEILEISSRLRCPKGTVGLALVLVRNHFQSPIHNLASLPSPYVVTSSHAIPHSITDVPAETSRFFRVLGFPSCNIIIVLVASIPK